MKGRARERQGNHSQESVRAYAKKKQQKAAIARSKRKSQANLRKASSSSCRSSFLLFPVWCLVTLAALAPLGATRWKKQGKNDPKHPKHAERSLWRPKSPQTTIRKKPKPSKPHSTTKIIKFTQNNIFNKFITTYNISSPCS